MPEKLIPPILGSIVAVTLAERNLASRENRFVGICITRERMGLHSRFTLRNIINGLGELGLDFSSRKFLGVEIMYELYNPTIRNIEVLKLERRLDNDLSYLVDALPEYSTFPFNMDATKHRVGQPVPLNKTKVREF